MVTVGALARFEAKSGNEAKVERFFQEGLAIVQQQKASTVWFAFRLSPTTDVSQSTFPASQEKFHCIMIV